MKVPSWITMLPKHVAQFFDDLERYNTEAKQMRREDRLGEIKLEAPTSSHTSELNHSANHRSTPPTSTTRVHYKN